MPDTQPHYKSPQMEPTYLDQLNPQQREAVCCTDAPSLVIAGAGSGKTRVLTTKIAYLLHDIGLQPQNIMALTFTNKAAREMKERVATVVGAQVAARITMGTFHSVFACILRREHEAAGFSSQFTIYDTSDSQALIKQIVQSHTLDDKKQYKPSAVLSRISSAKNQLILPDQYPAAFTRADHAANMPMVGQIYKEYQDRLQRADAMDFDDLLLRTWLLYHQHPEVADRYQEWYHYVLVDEYQDTNYAQHQIVLQLTQRRQRICVVGDDAQSIYSFRGAEIGNILHFRDSYQGARLFKLERNYRSTQTIVNAASSLIKHNDRQIPKEVFSENPKGSPIEVYHTYSDIDEATTVVRYLERLKQREGISYDDMAILYRTNSQSRSMEEELRRNAIPYRLYGGLSFYQRKEVKDAIAYLRLCANPLDETALHRIINYPTRGIGATTIDRVWEVAASHSASPWEVVQHAADFGLRAAAAKKLTAFATLMQQFTQAMNEGMDIYSLTLRILSESGMQAEVFGNSDPENVARQQNIQELTNSISAFAQERQEQGLPAGVTDYLQEVSLLTEQTDESTEANEESVTLMTVHASKGLEFRVVCVVGLEETLFPSQMALDEPMGLEEERRLFYVAMTRAGEHLALSCARSRMRYGHMEFSDPSRFLTEIDPAYLHINGSAPTPVRPRSTPIFGSQWQGSNTNRNTSTASRPTPAISSFARATQPTSNTQGSGRPQSVQHTALGKPSGQAAQHSMRRTAPQGAPGTGVHRLTPTRNFTSSFTAGQSGGPAIGPGQKIVHERFGLGTVECVEGKGLDAKATVMFESAGRKQLLLRFARFTLA